MLNMYLVPATCQNYTAYKLYKEKSIESIESIERKEKVLTF